MALLPRAEGPARPRAGEFVLLLLLAVVPFLNGLPNAFTYDDGPIVKDNPRLASPASFPELFATHYFGGPLTSGTAYRPVVLVTYAVQRWVHGLVPSAFRAVNISLHAGVTLLLFAWLLGSSLPRGPSFAASALFAAAAIHVEAVTSIVGRAETLAALLVLAAALLWRRAAAGDGPLRVGAFGGAFVAFLAAVFVKESAVVAPGLVLLGEGAELLLDRRGPSRTVAGATGEGGLVPVGRRALARLRLRGAAFAGLLVPVGVLFAVRKVVLQGFLISSQAGITELENPLAPMPALLRAANALVLVFRYAAKTLVPVGLAADHSGRALPLASSPWDGPCLAALAGLLLALGIGALAARSRPGVPFGLLLFLGALLPASNLPFPIGTIYAERLAYLPSAGLFLAVVSLVLPGTDARGETPRPSAGVAALLGAAVLVQGGLAAARNRDWRDDASLYADQVAKFPGSAKARYNLGWVLARQGRRAEALVELRKATELSPRHFEAWGFIGKLLGEEGRWREAEEACRRGLSIQPTHELSLWGLARSLEGQGRWGESLAAYDAAARLLPSSFPVAYHRARLLLEHGDAARAEREARRALVLSSRSPESLLLHARALRTIGREEAALVEARAALAASPRFEEARAFLAAAPKS